LECTSSPALTSTASSKAKYDEQVVREMLHSYKHGPDAAEMNRVAESDPAMDWRVWAKQLGVE
jgi:hypothetical protein